MRRRPAPPASAYPESAGDTEFVGRWQDEFWICQKYICYQQLDACGNMIPFYGIILPYKQVAILLDLEHLRRAYLRTVDDSSKGGGRLQVVIWQWRAHFRSTLKPKLIRLERH